MTDGEILIATKNVNKFLEIEKLLAGLGAELKGLTEYPDAPDVIEDKITFVENAAKKAIEYSKVSGLPALADDSGLEVEALGGAPGVHSARYAGDEQDDKKNIAKLLKALSRMPPEKRTASFKCLVVLARGDNVLAATEGICRGTIAPEAAGSYGFGYDPVFIPQGHDKTFAQLGPDIKDKISHRAAAFSKMAEIIKQAKLI